MFFADKYAMNEIVDKSANFLKSSTLSVATIWNLNLRIQNLPSRDCFEQLLKAQNAKALSRSNAQKFLAYPQACSASANLATKILNLKQRIQNQTRPKEDNQEPAQQPDPYPEWVVLDSILSLNTSEKEKLPLLSFINPLDLETAGTFPPHPITR